MGIMVFKYKEWDAFCNQLFAAGLISIPACNVKESNEKYIVLKHDVETDVHRAYELAKIEHKYGHNGSYYVQAYLMKNNKNVEMLKKMQLMGHEISYHYDVMDSNQGNILKAIEEFEANKVVFETNGFHLSTVCQHGNPVIERKGYTSNRDFFRNERVQLLYPNIADIMVNYGSVYNTNYSYFSDAGRQFCKIYDPINNDIIKSDEKNIKFENLNQVLDYILSDGNAIISTHPHRWTKSAFEYFFKNAIFRLVKNTAKVLLHIPGMQRIMGKFYYLAKKI